MNSGKEIRPVAVTTDLVMCHHSLGDQITTENYHSPRLAQADCLNNCFTLFEILPKVWKDIEATCLPHGNGGGK